MRPSDRSQSSSTRRRTSRAACSACATRAVPADTSARPEQPNPTLPIDPARVYRCPPRQQFPQRAEVSMTRDSHRNIRLIVCAVTLAALGMRGDVVTRLAAQQQASQTEQDALRRTYADPEQFDQMSGAL